MIGSLSTRSSAPAVREDALVLPVFAGTRHLGRTAARLDRSHTGAGALLIADGTFSGKRAVMLVLSIGVTLVAEEWLRRRRKKPTGLKRLLPKSG